MPDDFANSASNPEDASATQHFCAKRQQVLRGAEAVFLEHGYEGASMSQIAQRAKVSKGTLYNHFENKADLFAALIDELSRLKLATMFERISTPEGNCAETLVTAAAEFITILISPSPMGVYRIIVSEAPKFPHLADIFWRYGSGIVLTNMSAWLENESKKGNLSIDDPVFAAEQFFALCQTRIIQRRRLELPVDCSKAAIQEVAQKTGDAFLKIYGPVQT